MNPDQSSTEASTGATSTLAAAATTTTATAAAAAAPSPSSTSTISPPPQPDFPTRSASVTAPGPSPGFSSATLPPRHPLPLTSSSVPSSSPSHLHHALHQAGESPVRQSAPSSPARPFQSSSPSNRKDILSSMSTSANLATTATGETITTSYSAETSPNPHQSIFSVKDGTDVSNRRTSRRRTGPLSQQSRERAALIRKLGACGDCRRRRVACHPSHHNMTWEDVVSKFHRSHSPTIQEVPSSLAGQSHQRPSSPASGFNIVRSVFNSSNEGQTQDMDVDSVSPPSYPSGLTPISKSRTIMTLSLAPESRSDLQTPLPSTAGKQVKKSLSLPGIESLKNDLQASASRMISTASRNRYTAVYVMLLVWQEDDDANKVHSAVRGLAHTFEHCYHYTVQIQQIPPSSDGSRSSWRWLSGQLNSFAEDRDQRDVLKVVFYLGHSYLDANRDMVLASSADVRKGSTVRWIGVQQVLEQACSDTLIIMDTVYYPSSRIARQRGVLEIIAASVTEEHYRSFERCEFTNRLSEILRHRATRSQPLSAAELHALLLAEYPKLVRERHSGREVVTSFPAPLHAMASGNSRLPSIYISPITHGSPLRSGFSYENNPQLHLSIRLHDDNVDIDSWNEWLRLMPDGVKDVKVEGPFKPTFR